MRNMSLHSASTRDLERFLVVTGGVVCLIVSGFVWVVVGRQQLMWPVPDLYLLEMIAASMLSMFDILRNESNQPYIRGKLVWAAIGVLLAFVVIGAFSVGLMYAPVAGLIGVAAILSDRRQGHSLGIHIGIGLAAALIQVGLILIVIQLL